jgi:hypothetical protein
VIKTEYRKRLKGDACCRPSVGQAGRRVGVAVRTEIGLFAPMIRIGANQAKCGALDETFYRGLGGGGLGTPVVSYAPRPKLKNCSVDVTIMVADVTDVRVMEISRNLVRRQVETEQMWDW